MQPPLRQSVLCVGEKQKGCTTKKFWNRTKSVLCVGEKQRKNQGCDKWADLSPSCVLERNKGVKKFPVQKI